MTFEETIQFVNDPSLQMEEQDRLLTEIWARYMDYLYNAALEL